MLCQQVLTIGGVHFALSTAKIRESIATMFSSEALKSLFLFASFSFYRQRKIDRPFKKRAPNPPLSY